MKESAEHKMRVKRRTLMNTYGTAKPYLRTAIAIAVFLRFGANKKYDPYGEADRFLAQLEGDLEEEDGTE